MTSTMAASRLEKKKQGKPRHLTADEADILDLYERSVQDTDHEVSLITQVWNEIRGRRCTHIREDFCGTAAVCRAWVGQHPDNTAVGVDLDQPTLDWARSKMAGELTPEQIERVSLLHGDVLTSPCEPAECLLATNFSYFIFKTRDQLRRYFETARSAIKEDGIFMLDAYGGSDSFLEMEEERDVDGFTYIWDQHHYDPVTGDVVNHIHFVFPDSTKIRNAFTYEWRLWTLPELQELLLEAGFSEVRIYWEGTDEESGEGNGVWAQVQSGDADEGWVAYLVATP
ncbi:MAG: class I SAM-dependent methyltransferase [Phycisphaerales bacterium]|nr:class I SAM-dependent methyltransferase [Phycisphaerales bacterium]